MRPSSIGSRLATVLVLACVLSACGGSDNNSAPTPPTTPTTPTTPPAPDTGVAPVMRCAP